MFRSLFGDSKDDRGGIERSPESQARVDDATRQLAFYQSETCWYCRKVRRTIDRLKLEIESRDVDRDRGHRQRLVTEGGSGAVPCLYIEHDDGRNEWLYESSDICDYLERRFGEATDS
jgi:glutathione S-transferase